jgi:hypothetical protein
MAARIYFEEIFFYKGLKRPKSILSDNLKKVSACKHFMKVKRRNLSPNQLLPIWIFF